MTARVLLRSEWGLGRALVHENGAMGEGGFGGKIQALRLSK